MTTKDKKYKVFVEVKRPSGVGSTLREPTLEEFNKAVDLRDKIESYRHIIDKAEKALSALQKTCKHDLIYDVEGWPTDSRICYACGASYGSV